MAVTLAACGGGGGGFSSGSLGDGTNGNGSKNKFHHDVEVGKWGSGNATGGGFGGSCCLLVDPAAADRISAAITKEYKAKFGDEPVCSLIKPSEGAHLV